jgi:sugar/nucleoside kinase (ribokinase family)
VESTGVVLACGLATLDVVQTVEAVPTANQKVVADGLLVTVGGPAANAAVTCAELGVPSRLLSRIGGGPLASAVHADLAAHGVGVLDAAPPGSTPPVSTVLVTRGTGERAVISVNAGLVPDGSPADLTERAWDDVVVVLVDGHHLNLALGCAARARRLGIPVLLDGGSWKPGLAELLALVDVAVLSADFAVPGGDDALAEARALGPALVARSHGAAPIEVLGPGPGAARTSVPVPTVDVVDTLGAGDVLHGALVAWAAAQAGGVPGAADLARWLRGLTWAAEVASASCAAPGARGWAADTARVAGWRADLRRSGP